MRLNEAVSTQARLLDEIFNGESYQVEGKHDLVVISTDWLNLKLFYDLRDQCVASTVKPLRVPKNISEYHPTETLLRYLGMVTGPRRQSRLDEQQVRDELVLAKPLVALLRDERASSHATWFVEGYNAAYTDYCAGKWEPI